MLNDLYQEVILDHNRRPRNFKKIEGATSSAHGVNSLCGDDYYVYLKRSQEGLLDEVGFEGEGCAISKSSASMMTVAITGKSVPEAKIMKGTFLKMLYGESILPEDGEAINKLKIFEGVRKYPARIKCAALPWRALEDAIKNDNSSGAI